MKKRISFAKTDVRTPLPNLIETQQRAYNAFLQRDTFPHKDSGLAAVFNEVFPIADFNEVSRLEFVHYQLGEPKYTLDECLARGVTYQVSLTARLRLVVCEKDAEDEEPHVVDIRESEVYFGEVPLMTENASFIINGSERVIVNQLHRSPGVIFLNKTLPGGHRSPTAQIIPYRGAWIEFEADSKDTLSVRLNKRRKIPATVLLRALGWETDADILKLFAEPTRVMLSGWRVTEVALPECPTQIDALLTAAEHRKLDADYPGAVADLFYEVVSASDDATCPVAVGDRLTPTEWARHRKTWKDTTFARIWRIAKHYRPDYPYPIGDIVADANYQKARKKYPGIEIEACYRVTAVPDKGCPLEEGQMLTSKERTRARRKWRGFTTERLLRVTKLLNTGCPLNVGQHLSPTEYTEMLGKHPDAFKAERIESTDIAETIGSVCAEPIADPSTDELLVTANTLLTETEVERLRDAGVEMLTVLTPESAKALRFLRNTLERDKESDYEARIQATGRQSETPIQDVALLNIHSVLRPGEPASIEAAHRQLAWHFFDAHRYDLGTVGRYKVNSKLQHLSVYGEPPDEKHRTLRPEDIAATLRHLLDVQNDPSLIDDLDHLSNRRVRGIGELLENQFRIGLFQIRRATRERISSADMSNCMPPMLINPKPLMVSLREFFGSNQLSQFMQQVNPLDELTHKRRISAIGPGGLSRDRATAAVRDVHHTHYGRVCPLETPEGPSIGLLVSLACYARINPYGFIETPYHRVVPGKSMADMEIEYLTADKEDKARIAAKTMPRDAKRGETPATGIQLPARKGEDVLALPLSEVDYVGISPSQIVGVSAALVPFLEHEDANRALMGANHQRQAVPLIKPEAPLVGTGMEGRVARDSGALCIAKRSGTVESVSAADIIIHTDEPLHADIGEQHKSEMGYDRYELHTFKRSNSGTCIHQRPIVSVGDTVEAGDIIADGTSTDEGELALGRNVLCAYMPWGGHNYEDSILISESLVQDDTFSSIHIEEFEVEARETKMGPEEITRDIPDASQQRLSQLDEEGIIRVGSLVSAGSILVGKISPKGESEYGPEEKLLHVIFGEKVREVRDASTYVKPGIEGIVIDVKVFSRKQEPSRHSLQSLADADQLRYDAKKKAIEEKFHEHLLAIRRRRDEEIRNALIGCELAQPLFRGIDTEAPLSRTSNAEELDELDHIGELLAESGDIVTHELLHTPGIVLNEIHVTASNVMAYIQRVQEIAEERIAAYTEEKSSQLEQMELGDELKSGVLKLVKVYIATTRHISIGDKMAGRYGNKGVVAEILPKEDMPYLPDGTPVDIVLNPLGVPSRMNVGQILEIHLGWACHALGIHVESPVFDGATEAEIFTMLDKTGLPERSKKTGKSILYDGRTGEAFGQEVTVGYVYFLKLNHLVADKMHARSTGPYSLVTQQPLGGKAQHGGQRLGEMEVWALEAYGAAHTLQEMLTLKSDDFMGRAKIYESMVKGLNPESPGTPESFNVLVRELQGLGLSVSLNPPEEK